ncbi:MAG: hypothetical protein LQ337_003466 [Flavoplaca oasis]|nr:MAG: hypothetical protein LQ337_003466 [Flavoplaca oasis]
MAETFLQSQQHGDYSFISAATRLPEIGPGTLGEQITKSKGNKKADEAIKIPNLIEMVNERAQRDQMYDVSSTRFTKLSSTMPSLVIPPESEPTDEDGWGHGEAAKAEAAKSEAAKAEADAAKVKAEAAKVKAEAAKAEAAKVKAEAAKEEAAKADAATEAGAKEEAAREAKPGRTQLKRKRSWE